MSHRGAGRRRSFSVSGVLQVTLLSFRHKVTEQLIADLVGVHQATVSCAITDAETMLNVIDAEGQRDVPAAL
ncbi:transposase family protein [Rathayibacter toxicus]|uniref:transposase family protein n=1 Tax=Rathayibacter toxicus TaxID=145458 RepID=UPI001C05700E|nr:transposase family protein [Rathayibacter toxicus]QWL30644.1 transposase family protein [Rathayibacter toxicus]